ncbi:MAG: 30S ribosomal protein S27e [Candidatus Aenigmatarchaeota archaeon]
MEIIETPKSKFIQVMCKKCKNKQVIFSKASTVVKCLNCGEILAEPRGGDALVKGKILEVLG